MKTRPGAPATLAFAALLALTGCATTTGGDDMPGMNHGSSAATDVNEDDIEFATTMIAHHEQAMEASEVVLGKEDLDAAVTEFADRIAVAYQSDIDQLDTWLSEWDAEDADEEAGDAEEGAEDGTITDAELDALRDASGMEASESYLEEMIESHQAAIDIAQEHIEEGANPGAIDLSKKIIATHQLEIERMTEMLDSLRA
jgi:uncharacterized protein (DUF305 family)